MKSAKTKKTPQSISLLQFPEDNAQPGVGASTAAGVTLKGSTLRQPIKTAVRTPSIGSRPNGPSRAERAAATTPGNLKGMYSDLEGPTTGSLRPDVVMEAPSLPARGSKLPMVKNLRSIRKDLASPDFQDETKLLGVNRKGKARGNPGRVKSREKTNVPGKLPSNKPVLPDISKQNDRMLSGYLDNLPPQRSSVVRVFLSSTFSDFKAERNFLFKKAYPQLKSFCSEHGLAFQVTDLRWGISDTATNDHTVEALCLAEIRKCQLISAGPSIVVMLGNRYGFRPLIHEIPTEEFEMLAAIADELSLENREMLSTWYRLDENNVPPKYILQNIRCQLPHYGDESPGNEGLRKRAGETWNSTMKTIQTVLRRAVTEAFDRKKIDDHRRRQYFISVTEQEIEAGVLRASDPNVSCIAFLRSLEGLTPNAKDIASRKYIDTEMINGVPTLDDDAKSLMKKLKTTQLTNRLSVDNIESYKVPWKPGGLQPGKEEGHDSYLTRFSKDFVKGMKRLIKEHLQRREELRLKEIAQVVTLPPRLTNEERNVTSTKRQKKEGQTQGAFAHITGIPEGDLLQGRLSIQTIISEHKAAEAGNLIPEQLKMLLNAEILHHLNFCKNKCAVFCGREKELERARHYLTSQGETRPLVVTAPSGGGKTAFMAQVAKRTKTWVGDQGVTIVRFLGTSPDGSSLLPLLSSLCAHIAIAYGAPPQELALQQIGSAQKYFLDLLHLVSFSFGHTRPLVIVLDSVDQLSITNMPHLLHWLPRYMPPHVKIIISLVPDVHNGLENARAHLQDEGYILHLAPLALATAQELVVAHPARSKRRLSSEQLDYIFNKMATSDPQPLLLKLWLDEACFWRSYTPVDDLQLAATVEEAIATLFTKMEERYGHKFICAALGYITICLDGISEVELEDVLSCNDEVLNEVYKYHDPPVAGMIRIPPLLWTRARFDLKEYIVEHQGVNMATLSWYHRQFNEAATQRYASGHAAAQRHLELAELFLTEVPVCRTIHLQHRNLTVKDADRSVTIQELNPQNTRKMMCMSHHFAFSGDWSKFKENVICNYRYLYNAYEGIFIHDYIHEKGRIWRTFEDHDEEVSHVVNALRFQNPVISKNLSLFPVQLMLQLLPYAPYHPYVSALCSEASDVLHKSDKPCLKSITGRARCHSTPVRWYFEGPSGIIAQSEDGSHVLLRYSAKGKNIPFCQVFDVMCCQTVFTIYKNKHLANDVLYAGALARNNSRVYLLCKNRFVVHPVNDSGSGRAQYGTTDLNGTGPLNECIVVSSNDKYLVLAGPSRLVVLEDAGKSFNEPDFQMRYAMNFSGATATTNLLLSDDETMTITAHTIPGKNRVIGALSLWKFWKKEPCTKTPLPEPVPPGCLRRLPTLAEGNCVIAGCADGKVYIVNMNRSVLLHQISNDVGLRGLNLLLAVDRNQKMAAMGSKDGGSVAIFDIVQGTQIGHVNAKTKLQALQFGPDDSHITTLCRDGTLKLFDRASQSEKVSVVAHAKDATSLVCFDDIFILTTAYDKTLKQFDLKRLLQPRADCSLMSEEARRKNVVHAEACTFSLTDDGEAIITGNGSDGPCSWAVDTGSFQRSYSSQPAAASHQIVLANKGSRLLSLDRNTNLIQMWDRDTAEPVRTVRTLNDAHHMTLIGDGTQVAVLCQEGSITTIVVVNLKDNKEVLCITSGEKLAAPHQSWTTKNGRFLVFLYLESEPDNCAIYDLRIFDLEKGSEQDPIKVDTNVHCLKPCGQDMLVLGVRGHAVIWQSSVGAWDMSKFNGWLAHASQVFSKKRKLMEDVAVTCVSISPHEEHMATAGEDGSIIVWGNMLQSKKTHGTQGRPLRGHKHMVLCMEFSKTGRHLVSGSKDNTLRLWDTLTGLALAHVHLHAHVIDAIFVSNDQRVVVRTKGVGATQLSIWEVVGVNSTDT